MMQQISATFEDGIKVHIKEESLEEVLDIEDEAKFYCKDDTIGDNMESLTSDAGNLDLFSVKEHMTSLTCESGIKTEFKEEAHDELILSQEEGEHIDDITADTAQMITLQEPGVGRDLSVIRKLLQSTVPKKHERSNWNKLTTESILRFLKSFLTIARASRLTHCADACIALNGPRILKCEECFLEFSGLYDRYLKLFIHYKTSHRRKCNVLIGQKWIKHKAYLNVMVKAWKLDLKFELQNTCFG